MLSSLIWIPLIAALVIGLWKPSTAHDSGMQAISSEMPAAAGETVRYSFLQKNPQRSALKIIALMFSTIIFAITVVLMCKFDIHSSGMQFAEYVDWLPALGLSYSLGIDGISLPLLVLNALLTLLVIFSNEDTNERSKFFYAIVFLINAGVSGAFVAQNVLLFVLFYELELIPLYLMIAVWGSVKREYAAMKFLIFTAISGVLILLGFVALGWITANPAPNFDYDRLKAISLPLSVQIPILITLLIGFGIKIPLVPFHTWLPDTYVESSTSTTILLGGILAKLGAYGLFRFCLGLFPEAWVHLSPWLAAWAALGILYGACVAIAQRDLKRMVAYSSIGHMSYILLACAAATPLSLVGGVSQMVSHGLVLAILFYLVGIIESKIGTRDLDVLNGLLNPVRGLPSTSAMLIIGGMASAGIPGLVGFVAEFLVFQGSFSAFTIPTLLSIVGSGLTAVYFVILLNRTCFGKLDNNSAYYPKVTRSEQVPALILVALIFFLGIQPIWLTRWSEQASLDLVATIPTAEHLALVSDR
jgi:NAD(P)H-quinone oxidoreductase subunit 4